MGAPAVKGILGPCGGQSEAGLSLAAAAACTCGLPVAQACRTAAAVAAATRAGRPAPLPAAPAGCRSPPLPAPAAAAGLHGAHGDGQATSCGQAVGQAWAAGGAGGASAAAPRSHTRGPRSRPPPCQPRTLRGVEAEGFVVQVCVLVRAGAVGGVARRAPVPHVAVGVGRAQAAARLRRRHAVQQADDLPFVGRVRAPDAAAPGGAVGGVERGGARRRQLRLAGQAHVALGRRQPEVGLRGGEGRGGWNVAQPGEQRLARQERKEPHSVAHLCGLALRNRLHKHSPHQPTDSLRQAGRTRLS